MGGCEQPNEPVDSADFKNCVFPFPFFRWVSDTWDLDPASAVEAFGEAVSPEVEADCQRFVVPDGFHEFAPVVTPVIVENVVTDIDTIVRQVRFTGRNQTQNGDLTVRKEVRLTLKSTGLPTAGELFDRAYGYIREN